MPNDGKMKRPRRLQHRLLIALENKAQKWHNQLRRQSCNYQEKNENTDTIEKMKKKIKLVVMA